MRIAGQVQRKVISGPRLYTPSGNEWVHQFMYAEKNFL